MFQDPQQTLETTVIPNPTYTYIYIYIYIFFFFFPILMGRWYTQGRYTGQKNDSHPWQDPAGGHRRTWDFITLVRAARRHALQNLWIVYFWNFLFNTLRFIWLRVTETAGKEGLLYFACWGKKISIIPYKHFYKGTTKRVISFFSPPLTLKSNYLK